MIQQPSIEQQIEMNRQTDMNRKHGELVIKINSLEDKLETLLELTKELHKKTVTKK
jgi:hypothetical protein